MSKDPNDRADIEKYWSEEVKRRVPNIGEYKEVHFHILAGGALSHDEMDKHMIQLLATLARQAKGAPDPDRDSPGNYYALGQEADVLFIHNGNDFDANAACANDR